MFGRRKNLVPGTATVVTYEVTHHSWLDTLQAQVIVQAEGLEPTSVELIAELPHSALPLPPNYVLPVIVNRKHPSNVKLDPHFAAEASNSAFNELGTLVRESQAAEGRAADEAATTSPAPASGGEGEMSAGVKYESVAPDKTQRALELCEGYIDRDHPMDSTMQMLGVQRTKPVYKVVQGSVGRESQPHVDMKIVSVASCLPDEDVDASDTTVVARMAFDAIEHYASLPKVQAFFLLPYRLRTRTVAEGSPVPPEEACRVYSGVENLLLEIYEELPNGGTITDNVVEQKIDAMIESVA